MVEALCAMDSGAMVILDTTINMSMEEINELGISMETLK